MFGKNGTQPQLPDLEFFTVYDSKSKTYGEPFPAMNRDVVLRDFMNAFKNPEAPQNNRYYINAEDFSIFKVGSFEKRTGKLEGYNLEHVVNLHDLRAMAKPEPGPGALSAT